MTTLTVPDGPVRHRIRVVGVVQGVGFRPFVHRLATELDLAGQVGNDTEGVLVEVEGRGAAVECFESRLVVEAPPLARIAGVEATAVEAIGEHSFRIVESRAGGTGRTFVSPDMAVCDDCVAEMWDPADRRYRYPFINCTNCGPRFTITVTLPYDRPNTTMRAFPLCASCAGQYHDSRDRRFHAQPLACAACGPRLWFEGAEGAVHGADAAVAAAQAALAAGGIVAVKGLGGYHLACDATSDAAVGELRRRKHRPDKPLAVMVADLATAAALAELQAADEAILSGPQRPIVLLRRRAESPLSALVASGSPHLGVLLPYTPLHHLLFAPVPVTAGGPDAWVPSVLVMTSGNLSDEPICYDDADARRRLGAIATGWLVHDRLIHVPCDDSVVRTSGRVGGGGEERPVRRSRGYAPLPVRLPFECGPLLAAGGELKNTFCLASGRDAWMSQHIGDMGSVETLDAFERSTRQFADVYGIQPVGVAADAHPGYQTRRWAERRASLHPVTLVQHHHAHIAAAMVEHGVPAGERVIGYAFDGTGYGPDGAIWGGEVLVAGYGDFERAAHLRYVAVPGGDAAVRKPYRVASRSELAVLDRQLQRNVNCAPTSSMGRLFDAVSSLIGVRQAVSYEAQAAIELEAMAGVGLDAAGLGAGGLVAGQADIGDLDYAYRFATRESEIDPGPVLRAIVDDRRDGLPIPALALGFHVAVARLVADTAEQIGRRTGIDRVALSGGVWQNVLLVALVRACLEGSGLRVLTHRIVPPNDAGLALGQVAVAGYRRLGQ
jgi:hydrogenase maturation protein HypF